VEGVAGFGKGVLENGERKAPGVKPESVSNGTVTKTVTPGGPVSAGGDPKREPDD